jgi:hypothetical protein
MAGFDNTNALSPAVRTLRETIPGNPQVLWTVSSEGKTDLILDDPPSTYGKETRLFESVQMAVRRFPQASSLWLLTDNQPSHDHPDQDLEHLYDWLRGSKQPYAVTLVVLKLPFRGKIYRASDLLLASDYRGDRAVVLYAALLDREAKEDFRKAVDRVAAALERYQPRRTLRLRCKPLQEDSVALEVESGTMERLPDGTLRGKGREGQVFHGTFTIKVRSKLDHVTFYNARPTFAASEFKTVDFDTREVQASLAEKDIQEIGRGWTGIEAALSLEPVRLRRNFTSALKAFAKGKQPGVLEGDLTLKLAVDRKSVVIVPEDVRAFTTDRSIFEDPSPEVQSRVYRLQELFQEKFVEDTLELVPGQVPVRIEMAYSPVSAAILVGTVVLPLVVILALVLAYFSLFRARFQLIGEGCDGRPFRIRGSRPVRGSAGLLGSLHQIPPLLWFRAAHGWEVGPRGSSATAPGNPKAKRPNKPLWLSREGGAIDLRRRSDGLRVRLKLVRVR